MAWSWYTDVQKAYGLVVPAHSGGIQEGTHSGLLGRTGRSVAMEALVLVLTLLLLVLVTVVIHKWWDRWRMATLMRKQGIHGPPIGFRHLLSGHSKEMAKEREMATLVDLPSMTHDISSRVLPFHTRCRKEYGNNFFYWWGEDPVIMTTDSQLARTILVNKFGHYGRSSQIRRTFHALLGDGLVMAEGEDWAYQRRLINPAFHQEKLKRMVGTMTSSTAAMLSRWQHMIEEAGGPVELQIDKELYNLAAEIISQTAFGTKYERGKQIFDDIISLAMLTSRNTYHTTIPFYSYLPTQWNKRISQTTHRVETAIQDIMAERYRLVKAGQASMGTDLLGTVMQASENLPKTNVQRDALQFVVDECKTFYFAGLDTTSSALQWVILLLALHPEWQEKARAEVDEVTHNSIPTADMLNRLKIVGMIVHETLRLYPPAPAMTKQASKDIQVGNIFIPKGVTLLISILDMHRDPDMWGPDALEFNPNRFRDGMSKACKDPASFMPFSMGPRNCIGQVFATLEIKETIAMLLQRFQIRVSPAYRHAPLERVTVIPQHGVPLLLSLRPPLPPPPTPQALH